MCFSNSFEKKPKKNQISSPSTSVVRILRKQNLMSNLLHSILKNARILMLDSLPECFEPIEKCFDNTRFILQRKVNLKENVEIPLDLNNALEKKQISIQHLPKQLIQEYLIIVAKKTTFTVNIKVGIHQHDGKSVCDDTFVYTID